MTYAPRTGTILPRPPSLDAVPPDGKETDMGLDDLAKKATEMGVRTIVPMMYEIVDSILERCLLDVRGVILIGKYLVNTYLNFKN